MQLINFEWYAEEYNTGHDFFKIQGHKCFFISGIKEYFKESTLNLQREWDEVN